LAAIFAVGLRPCSGAILVLVFALAQGLFWAGVASTFIMGLGTALTVAAIATLAVGAKGLAKRLMAHREGAGAVALRGLEACAAVLVLVFGVALLMGYMTTERMAGL
jgi:nickel/cobalt exporter